MKQRDPRTFALALEARARHRATPEGTCAHCLPFDTPWPCLPLQLTQATLQKLGADFPAPPVHPDWLNGDAT